MKLNTLYMLQMNYPKSFSMIIYAWAEVYDDSIYISNSTYLSTDMQQRCSILAVEK